MAGILSLLAGGARAGLAADTGRMQGEREGLLAKMRRDEMANESARRGLLDQLNAQNIQSQIADREADNARLGAGVDGAPTFGMSLQEVVDPATGKRVLVQASNRGETKVAPYEPVPERQPQGSFIQYVDESGRPVSFNPGTGAVVRAPEGLKPAGAAGDRNTATVRKQVAANKTNLGVIDDAIAGITQRPESVGLSRGVGKLPFMGGVADVINQRVDPEGVAARASLSNIGSLVIHDRSGAAVSIHEYPRLAPFIPDISDRPDVALTKLRKLRDALVKETEEMEKGTLLVNPTESDASSPPSPQGEQPPPGPADVRQFMPPARRTP